MIDDEKIKKIINNHDKQIKSLLNMNKLLKSEISKLKSEIDNIKSHLRK